MRKGALLLSILMLAAAPTMASAKAKKMKHVAKPKVYSTTAANMNEGSWKLVHDGLWQFAVPTQSIAAASQRR